MPTRVKGVPEPTWELLGGVCIPNEVYVGVLVEEADREVLELTRLMTREQHRPPRLAEH